MTTLTVVFDIKDKQSFERLTTEFQAHFGEDDNKVYSVTAMSTYDEMTKLDLIEFAHEVNDMDLIGTIINSTDISEYLELKNRIQAFADKKSITLGVAYEEFEE